jgi:hypothetical protein
MLCHGARAKATYRAHVRGFDQWVTFATDNDCRVMPPREQDIFAFVAGIACERKNLGALTVALAALKFACMACGKSMPKSDRIALLVQAARRQWVDEIKKAPVLPPDLLRKTMEGLMNADATDKEARVALALGLGCFGGARWNDIDQSNFEKSVVLSDLGMEITPTSRKNHKKGDRKRLPATKTMYIAKGSFTSWFRRARARYDWAAGPIAYGVYGTFLSHLRKALQGHGGLTAEQARKFSSHSMRRMMATEGRRAGAEEHQLEEAAGVSTGGWASVYAETSVEERFAVSALIQEVAW